MIERSASANAMTPSRTHAQQHDEWTEKIVGHYRIIEKIGMGGMCAVYRATDLIHHRDVALKALHPEFARHSQSLERFCLEAVTLAKLRHPALASVYSFFRHGDHFFIAMEFVRGLPLDRIIRQSGAMPYQQAIPLFCEILDGIAHAHQAGIVHRDIKPDNIMLTDAGTIKVMDFGIARLPRIARVTQEGMLVGTPEYMSPEQFGAEELDARSDIYSLGVVLFEMLTGRLPFTGRNEYELMKQHVEATPPAPRALVPGIPARIEAAILRALAKKPSQRFQSATEFRAELAQAVPPRPTMVETLPSEKTATSPPIKTATSPPIETHESAHRHELSVANECDQAARTREVHSTPVEQTNLPRKGHATRVPLNQATLLNWRSYAIAVALVGFISFAAGLATTTRTPAVAPPPPPQSSLKPSDHLLRETAPPRVNAPAAPARRISNPPRKSSEQQSIALAKKEPRRLPDNHHAQSQVSQKTKQADNRVGRFFRRVGGGIKKVGSVFKGGDDK
ncbi:MAG: serine/threonine-protein kinase [Acidobacteriota bacterium]|nr:serine/threonine-protein kinase [Acidobacteriota bacterium]